MEPDTSFSSCNSGSTEKQLWLKVQSAKLIYVSWMIWSLNQNIKEAEKEVHFLKSVLSQPQSGRKYLQFMYLTKGLNLKICKEFQQTNKKKVNNLMGKNSECRKSMQMAIYERCSTSLSSEESKFKLQSDSISWHQNDTKKKIGNTKSSWGHKESDMTEWLNNSTD